MAKVPSPRPPIQRRGPRDVIRAAAALPLLVILAACGEQPVTIDDPDPTPVEEGVALEGDPQSPAVGAVRELGPTPAPASEIDDGFFRTRLRAVIAPTATVGDVNDALELYDAGIATMRPGLHAVTLVVPGQPSVDDARALAAAIASTPAFAFVSPAFELGIEAVRARPLAMDLPASGKDGIDHWALMRMPAAWNAAKLAVDNGQRVRALVPDSYGALTPHPQIGVQSFAGAGGITEGNSHGFLMSGLIGADYDDVPVSGASPRPEELVGITSIPMGGLAGWVEAFHQIRAQLPPSGPIVLNTSIGPERLYEGSEGTELGKEELIERALDALFWRYVMGQQYDRFLHVGAAGNDADTEPGTASDVTYDAAWFVSTRWDDPYDMIPPEMLTEQERIDLEGLFDSYYQDAPWTQARSPNVLAVGASDGTGAKMAMSNANEDLRTIGEDVLSTCLTTATSCVEGTKSTSGTSVSAAIVSGVAAYLWNLKPSMSVAQLRSYLLDGYTDAALVPGILDAYNLVLGLDAGLDIVNAPVRRTLLDVTGPGLDTPPNGVFDEEDLAQFLTLFQSFEVQREGMPVTDWDLAADYSRYDLNGNGITHEFGDGDEVYAGPFDLDADGGLAPEVTQLIDGQTLPFNESGLTDMDVLCYYAFSDLYAGDIDSRRNLLGDICGNRLVVDVQVTQTVIAGVNEELVVRVGRPATEGTEWLEAAEVDITVENGSVTFDNGITDADGYFRTTLVPNAVDPESYELTVEVLASDGGGASGEATVTLSHSPTFWITDWPTFQAPQVASTRASFENWDSGPAPDVDTTTVSLASPNVQLSSNLTGAFASPIAECGARSLQTTSRMTGEESVANGPGTLTYEIEFSGEAAFTVGQGQPGCGFPALHARAWLQRRVQIRLGRGDLEANYTATVSYESDHPWMDDSGVYMGTCSIGLPAAGTDATCSGTVFGELVVNVTYQHDIALQIPVEARTRLKVVVTFTVVE